MLLFRGSGFRFPNFGSKHVGMYNCCTLLREIFGEFDSTNP